MVIYMVIWTLLYPVVPGPQTTVIADTPVEVFRLSRADYDAVLRELPEERQASTLAQTVAVDRAALSFFLTSFSFIRRIPMWTKIAVQNKTMAVI